MTGGPAYLVCTSCAHYWLAGEPPADSRCEHCRQVVVFWELATLAEAEERSQRILDRRASHGPAPLHGGPCPGCGRIMSRRELVEQGACNDCHGGAYDGGRAERPYHYDLDR